MRHNQEKQTMNAAQTGQPAQLLQQKDDNGTIRLECSGDWINSSVHGVHAVLAELDKSARECTIEWDVSRVGRVDSVGMMLFMRHYDTLRANHCAIDIVGASEEQIKFYRMLRRYPPHHVDNGRSLFARLLQPLHFIGTTAVTGLRDSLTFLDFLGELSATALSSLLHPFSIRFGAIVKNIEEAGVRALPIVALTSFLIGIVIAYQGAVQLEKFGANIFIVDMIGLSLTRELAPLITAIVVAGRTGSSYTAQIGVMKLTEEIDAMRTMGFYPQQFLVLPRIMALMITLPLLIFFADIIGIGAGMFISHVQLHISYAEFIHRLQSVLAVKHVWIGIIKGPFFAWLIGSVSCFRGFQVSNNTESIGRYTTISVVNAIFLVIACDALFSVLLTRWGI